MNRICSFVPSGTEILAALGLVDQIVGVSHECDYPPAIAGKPRLMRTRVDPEQPSARIDAEVREAIRTGAALYDVDAEALEAARPELLLTQSLCDVCAVDANLIAAAAKRLSPAPALLALHPHTVDEILDDIRAVGAATGRQEQAEALVAAARARIAKVQALVAGRPRPRVCCVEWLEPLMGCGHWVPQQVELAGGQETLGRAGEPSRGITAEELVAARPDILMLMPCGFSIDRTVRELPQVQAAPWWAHLPAVRAGQVYLVNGPAYFNRSGPRVVDGIELLARLFHGVPVGPSSTVDARRL